ncbi:hypothetical protein Acr_12g0000710 [Actinidia rufa]|uniref:Integrase catalytic domain-containing protein n=1 Tax=Actinidia rufa TaxID=165716 RepID=A0A7J0FFQ8_9ERIC|nr:hypothetical protein Acr_12g0000710 [Actinidia rufa]
MSGSDVDNVENVVVPPPPPRPDFSLSQHTPGARITCELLNGKNFAAWSRSVRLFLGGKGKSGWLLGTITKPNATDPKFLQWEIDNCTILGWLFNSMEPWIYHVFMYHDMVPLLWSSLTKMYAHAHNEARIFELYREIHQASQASLSFSVADYFAYLQSRWEELAQYEPLSEFTTEGGIAARRLDRQHTYQFLMGLKPEFEALRTQIVNTTPMPSIFEAFAMLDGDERRHRLLQLRPPPVTESTIPDQMALAASGSRFSGGRSSSGRAPCSFCGGVTHGRDRCFKLHPELRETFKRNKEKSKASPRTAAISETSYGSHAAPTAPDLHQLQTQFQNQMEQLQLQFQTQLGSLMQQSPRPNPSPSTATLASGIPTALHVRSSNPSWVLDSGADDHMTGPEFEEDFWQGMIKTQFKTTVRTLRSDNGREYVSNDFRSALSQHGLLQQFSCPYTPEQNGVAKRKNRSIMTVVRCLLCGMHVPKHFWDMAVLTATYLLNRTPSRILLGKAPLHLLQLDCTLFPILPRVFGCTCFVQNRSPSCSKLDDKAFRCVFLGYSFLSKGYRCYDPLTSHMHNSFDVTFLEDVPFFAGTPHSLNPHQGEAPEDPSIFSRPVSLFESPQVASPTLPPVLTSDPRHMYSRRPPASDPLPQSSPESGNISPISSPVLRRYPTRDRRPPDKLGFSNPNATKHSVAQYVSYQGLSDSYRTFIGHVSSTPIPRSVSEALRDPNWVTAMQVEMAALQQNHTWDLVSLPRGDDASGIERVKQTLRKAFDTKDLGPLRYFLGIEVARSRRGISLSQRKYVLDLLQDTGMMGCRPASSPMDPNFKLSLESGDLLPDATRYQRLVRKR